MKSLIIGNGQIGSALFEIFSKVHETHVRDFEAVDLDGVEILHIAYPYSKAFVETTKDYIDQYKPGLTMIHSTVKIGTTEQCGPHVVHTPERGRFPHLAKEMKVYRKFIGGFDVDDLDLAEQYFKMCKWETQLIDDPEITETLKLVSNAHMGLEIAWRQELERWGIDRESLQLWESSYFQGYMYLGQHHLVRPQMRPDPIGGHCILPSIDILLQTFDSPCLEFVRESDGKTKRQSKQIIDERVNGDVTRSASPR